MWWHDAINETNRCAINLLAKQQQQHQRSCNIHMNIFTWAHTSDDFNNNNNSTSYSIPYMPHYMFPLAVLKCEKWHLHYAIPNHFLPTKWLLLVADGAIRIEMLFLVFPSRTFCAHITNSFSALGTACFLVFCVLRSFDFSAMNPYTEQNYDSMKINYIASGVVKRIEYFICRFPGFSLMLLMFFMQYIGPHPSSFANSTNEWLINYLLF